MTQAHFVLISWLAVGLTLAPALTAAQVQPAPPALPAPAAQPAPPAAPALPAPAVQPAPPAPDDGFRTISFGRPAIRIGQDYTLRADAAVREAVVILGDATIEGRVDQNVVVVLGNATVTDTAFIDDSLVVIGGTVTASPNARIEQDLVIVGGALDAPPGFTPRGQYVVIGTDMLGGQLQALVPWLSRGLLWGRLIVPDLGWIWSIVVLFFLAYAALNLLFHKAVYACAQTLAERPLTAFAVGVLALLLVGPVSVLLAVSVVGIVVIPFVVCALIVAGILGRIAVARWIGMNAVRENDSDSRPQSLRSFAIGFAVICVAYMIPVVGVITWATLGVLGLGAGTLAFMNAYRRENPPALRKTPPPVPPAPVIPGPAASSGPDTQPAYMAAPPLQATAADEVAFAPPPPPLPPAPPAPPPFNPPPPAAAAFMAATSSELVSFPRATFLDRLGAFVLDLIVVLFVYNVLDFGNNADEQFFFMLLLVYHIGFWAWKGTTLGGIILNLRVVRMDGYALRFVDALVRGLSSIFSAIVLGLGFLWILKDPERQAWHDRIAGTYVVKVPRTYPL